MFNAIRRAFAALTNRRVHRRAIERAATATQATTTQRRKLRLATQPRRKLPDMRGLCVKHGRLEVAGTRRKLSGSRGLR